MTNILCIETGTDTCSVGLARDGKLVALRESVGERDHAARVAVFTNEILSEANISCGGGNAHSDGGNAHCGGGNAHSDVGYAKLGRADLTAVAVSKGPGSYTGLRIGVSFAKGLCYALGVPLIGIGSLEALCAAALQKYPPFETGGSGSDISPGGSPTLFIPMIDARRMEVYGQVFDAAGTALTNPEAWIVDHNSLDEWRARGPVAIFGSGAAKCRQMLPWAHYIDIAPSASGMVALSADALSAGRFEDVAYFEPLYLKDFVITTSKKNFFSPTPIIRNF